MAGKDGLTFTYRLGWNIRRLVMSVFGPAQLGEDDPLEQLRRERAQKVAQAARESRS